MKPNPFQSLPGLKTFSGQGRPLSKLAAVRMLYDFCRSANYAIEPGAFSSRAKYVIKKGKTPVWSHEGAKTLLDSIPKDLVSGLRDRALIAAMVYSVAQVSAVLKLKFDDYYHNRAPEAAFPCHQGGVNREQLLKKAITRCFGINRYFRRPDSGHNLPTAAGSTIIPNPRR